MRNLLLTLLIYFTCSLTIAQLNLEWATSFGGNSVNPDKPHEMILLSDGNILLAGTFAGPVDFDPTGGVTNLSTGDGFIAKYDPQANMIWARELVGNCNIQGVAEDASGNIIAAGYFDGSVDFDPGSGTAVEVCTGFTMGFVLKLDANGDFVWVKRHESSGANDGGWIRDVATIDDDIYTTGFFSYTIDFDPDPGTHDLTAWGVDIFMMKQNASGNLVWVHQIGGSNNDAATRIVAFDSGDLYVTGHVSTISVDTIDFDPDPIGEDLHSQGSSYIQHIDSSGNHVRVLMDPNANGFISPHIIAEGSNGDWYAAGAAGGNADMDLGPGFWPLPGLAFWTYVQKFNSNDELEWVRIIQNDSTSVNSLSTDAAGDVYVSSKFSNVVDINTDPYLTQHLVSSGSNNKFFVKLSENGDFIYGEQLPPSILNYVVVKSPQEIYMSGGFVNTIDMDLGPGVQNVNSSGGQDIFFGKYNVDPCEEIYVSIDSASNGSCSGNGYVSGQAFNGTPPYSYVWNTSPPTTGNQDAPDGQGIYVLTVTDNYGCSASASILVNFPAYSNEFDLVTHLMPGPAIPGNILDVWLDGYNDGCQIVSGEMTFVFDPLLTYVGSTIPPSYMNGDTLVWDYGPGNYDSLHLQPHVYLEVPTTLVVGDSLDLDVIITPLQGDIDITNNYESHTVPITNGQDPNDKQVYPAGECPQHFILDDQTMTYTVRFFNNGNGNAINIAVMDSISTVFDLSTIRILAASHAGLITEIFPDNWVQFRFDNINLPPESLDSVGCHGYVIFGVDIPDGVPHWTDLSNTAEIYFDYNPAVITNTVQQTIVDYIDCSLGFDMLNSEIEMTILPNPTDGIVFVNSFEANVFASELIDFNGKTLRSYGEGETILILENVPAGVYFLRVSSDQGVKTFKLIVR